MKTASKVDSIYESKDYDKFKLLIGNRVIDDSHVRELIDNIKEVGNLKIPIVVNDKMEIIDGQHRYLAWSMLGEPITYILKNGIGLKEAQVMNVSNKNWTEMDYLQSYIKLGAQEYVRYNKFRETYGFGHAVNLVLLTGSQDWRKEGDAFKRGSFTVRREKEANVIATAIVGLKPYYENYKRRSFVLAFRTLFRTPGYRHDYMVQKMKIAGSKLAGCSDYEQFIEGLVNVWNYHTDQPDRFSLLKDGSKTEIIKMKEE